MRRLIPSLRSACGPRLETVLNLGASVALALAHVMTVADARAAAESPATISPLFDAIDRAWQAAELGYELSPADPAGRARACLQDGRPEEARYFAAELSADDRAHRPLLAEIYLANYDFAAAKPLCEALLPLTGASEAERELCFRWLRLIDDSAEIDRRTRAISIAPGTDAPRIELIAAGRLALDRLLFGRADSCFARAVEQDSSDAPALRGLGEVAYRRNNFDLALRYQERSLASEVSADGLYALSDVLIRLGRIDEAITAGEWALRFDPLHQQTHYLLGNGYARRNYTELRAAHPDLFLPAERFAETFAEADRFYASGDRDAARRGYLAILAGGGSSVEALVRLASLDWEAADYRSARERARRALVGCPEYGRAHAVLAKALESERYRFDVHRAEYEARFEATGPAPEIPGIERFVINWNALTPRHQKRVALSIAPWQHYLPVLIAGGSTFYIKPLFLPLSDCPGQEGLRDLRISYDSRLWDDVRGCGGYRTVTGIEDVERTIFDKYNTVLHELTHQVHSVLPAETNRVINEHYRAAKLRDDGSGNGFLSRYAGGSVYEYLAEGANGFCTHRRDAYDPRDIVRDRLERIDPALLGFARSLLDAKDVSASYAVALSNKGGDLLQRGEVASALVAYEEALQRNPIDESALTSVVFARLVSAAIEPALRAAEHALELHPTSGAALTTYADALWRAGHGVRAARVALIEHRPRVRDEDRPSVDLALGRFAWLEGDPTGALAAYDSALTRQDDLPEALWGRGAALAQAGRFDDAFGSFEAAVRARSGILSLRCDYARELLRAGRLAEARAQADAAMLLDPSEPMVRATEAWVTWKEGRRDAAEATLSAVREEAPWCDLAPLLLAAIREEMGDRAGAQTLRAPLRSRVDRGLGPEYVYRPERMSWESTHEFPFFERELLGTP